MRWNREWGRAAPGMFLGAMLVSGIAIVAAAGWSVVMIVRTSVAILGAA